MFMWKYFILYFGCGLLLGLSSKADGADAIDRPIEKIFPWVVLLTIGLLIWNFVTFGIVWALVSLAEVFAGMVAASMMKNRSG